MFLSPLCGYFTATSVLLKRTFGLGDAPTHLLKRSLRRVELRATGLGSRYFKMFHLPSLRLLRF